MSERAKVVCPDGNRPLMGDCLYCGGVNGHRVLDATLAPGELDRLIRERVMALGVCDCCGCAMRGEHVFACSRGSLLAALGVEP